MCAAEIESYDNADAGVVALLNDIAEHVGLHVGVGVLAIEFGRIERHDSSGVDDECIRRKVLQVSNKRVGTERGFIGRKIRLDHAKVVGFPPGKGDGPGL